MLLYIYCQPLWLIVAEMFAAIAIWTWLGLLAARKTEYMRVWKAVNLALLLLTLGVILYATVLDRSASQYEQWLKPFEALHRAKQQPELYRSMLMNVFLFLPFGLTLTAALPECWRSARRIVCTVGIGLVLSLLVEGTQYICMLGTAEADDVICNTLGAALGAAHLSLQTIIRQHR